MPLPPLCFECIGGCRFGVWTHIQYSTYTRIVLSFIYIAIAGAVSFHPTAIRQRNTKIASKGGLYLKPLLNNQDGTIET